MAACIMGFTFARLSLPWTGNTAHACFLLPHLAAATFLLACLAATPICTIAARRSGVIVANPFGTFFLPPLRPRATAAGFFFFWVIYGNYKRLSKKKQETH